MIENKRGVSLIVLVITIIVIIILAAAVILTINNNNPMDNANIARYTSDRANIQNALSTAIGKIAAEKLCSVTIPAQDNIVGGIGYTLTGASDGVTSGKIGWDTLAIVSGGEEATTILGMKLPNYGSGSRWFINSNGEVCVEVAEVIYGPDMTTIQPGVPVKGDTKYTVGGNTAVIPNGFSVSTEPTEQSIDGGLVVRAPDASEFVWVPVNNIDDMFSRSSETPLTYAGKLIAYSKNGNVMGTVMTSSPSGYREPDKVVGSDTISYDNVPSNLNDINDILETTLKTGDDLQAMMQKEINAMHESIRINKGFYIGRYETGDLKQDKVVSKKDNEDIANKTWYEMYAKQKKYATQINTGVKSSMIYGSQWDSVMRWFAIDSKTEGYIIDASGEKGNWGKKEETGVSGYPVKNIYDMAGNVWDWTAEAGSSNYRVLRGAGWYSIPDIQYAGYRGDDSPTGSYDFYGSRLALYL